MDLKAKQELIIRGALAAPIVLEMGCKFFYNAHNEAVWTLPFSKTWTNGMVVHGGVIATLIDNAGFFTVLQYWDTMAATVEFQTRLLDFVKEGDLVAVGHLVKLGKKFATASVEVKRGNDLIAIGSGTYALTPVPLPGS